MIKVSEDFNLVVPRLGNMVEPLHAVYSEGCLVPIENTLMTKKLAERSGTID
jgi:hypothetical protein